MENERFICLFLLVQGLLAWIAFDREAIELINDERWFHKCFSAEHVICLRLVCLSFIS